MSGHQSVLLEESIQALSIKPDGIYMDGTFGRGGHTTEILKYLNEAGRLIAIDKDLEAVEYARQHFAQDKRFHIFHGSFADITKWANEAEVAGNIDGILLDLGVSSPQLDNPERGFSFIHNGPLDMRMDMTNPLDAATFVNTTSMEDMAHIFRQYGEERFAGRIARAIVETRVENPFTTTAQLAEVVKKANPKWEKHKHPATRVFQAIRIYINQELHDLESCLAQSVDVLKPGGRLAVISFHSLEDRMVKQFMLHREQGEQLPKEVPVFYKATQTDFRRVGKAIKPAACEIQQNVRARSAVLRTGEKIA